VSLPEVDVVLRREFEAQFGRTSDADAAATAGAA
jgi:hypothetical protein